MCIRDSISAAIHERRSRLMAEAEVHRQARQVQQHAPRRTRLLLGRLLAAAGAHLVHWGRQLQAHQPDVQTNRQET